jgi:hypothetical protein
MPYKDKCVSTCKDFEKPECNPPRCKYINGQLYKYCRLSHKYKMNKPNCNVTRRIKKKEIQQRAIKVINNFIKKSGKFLQTICSDSGECIAFGKNVDEITNYFNGFTNFDYVESPIHKIGAVSVNGFVKEISYEKKGYHAHTILKSSQRIVSDNLVYEYLVGTKYINRAVKSLPCFLQTYGLYFYNSDISWKLMKDTKPIHKAILKGLNIQNTINYSKACQQSKYAAVLIQHIKEASAIKDQLSRAIYTPFLKSDILYVLFIVYHALHSLSKNFTHYDLHDGNVLLYMPVKGKYIQYHYHNADGSETTFYSPYIPKIIDYGRCFFDNGNTNSNKIYNNICTINECKPDCGEDYGFGWLNPEPLYFISSSKKNESHDLRLLNIIKTRYQEIDTILHEKPDTNNKTFIEIEKILKKVVYGAGILDKNEKEYGTKENLELNKNKIYNVTGAYLELKHAIENPDVSAENQMRYNKYLNKLGDFHIYHDGRPMLYQNI